MLVSCGRHIIVNTTSKLSEMYPKVLLMLTVVLKSVSSIKIQPNFLISMMETFSKKHVVWHLQQDLGTVQMKRGVTDFGRYYPTMILGNQAYYGQEQDISLFVLTNQNIHNFLEIFEKRLFHPKSLWLVDMTDMSEPLADIFKKLEALEAEFDNEIILFKVNNSSFIELWEVYKISHRMPMKLANEGYWSEHSGVRFENENHRHQRLRDLQGLHLKLGSKVSKPYITEMIPDTQTNYKINGLLADVFYNLQVGLFVCIQFPQ